MRRAAAGVVLAAVVAAVAVATTAFAAGTSASAAGPATAGSSALPLYREGPPPAHTGGFGEPLCTECHYDAPVNDAAGELTLDAPGAFEPGEAYELSVTLSRPELAAAGFQLAIRFAEGHRAGEQAGTLESVSPRAAVTTDTTTGVLYGHQTAAGTVPDGSGASQWTLRWTAPDSTAVVLIHVAGNAANDDASEFGDHIYSAERRASIGNPGARRTCTR